MDKHLVLIRYLTVEEAEREEKYERRHDLEELYAGVSSAEAMIYKFAAAGRWKCACDLMAYVAHKRAAVWWVYKCLLSLFEEFKVNPPEDRDIADIGANFEVTVPDFAKVEPPVFDTAAIDAEFKAKIAEQQAAIAAARAQIDPEILRQYDEALEYGYSLFEKQHGIHPLELIKQLTEKLKEPQETLDPNAPLFKAVEAARAQVAAVQKATVATIKEAIPPRAPKHEKMLQDNAMEAVWRWIAAPDQENSQKCFDAANACAGTEASLLAFSAFWAFGDLMPLGKQPVPTPPGLAPNGFAQTMMKCALAKGGTRKVAERYEHYFRLGVEVLTGKENWADALETGTAPHSEQGGVKYERWK
jgi:hypothetical protein